MSFSADARSNARPHDEGPLRGTTDIPVRRLEGEILTLCGHTRSQSGASWALLLNDGCDFLGDFIQGRG